MTNMAWQCSLGVPQLIQYFKMVFLEKQNVPLRTVFKPGMHGQRPRSPVFWKLLWFGCRYVSVCLSVCLPLRALITSGVIWCDIDQARSHINAACRERLPKKTKVMRY